LDTTDFFSAAHTAAAQTGQSAVPEDLDVDTHFIAFIEAVNDAGSVSGALTARSFGAEMLTRYREKRVVELDGGREGPFDRGTCTSLLHVSDLLGHIDA
jgi:ubiquitin carboxyl-terminal hydrolase L3